MNKIFLLPKRAAVAIIIVYQKTLSPDHGLFKARFPYGYCRHYPSCSEYTKQAIEKKGLLKGVILGFIRILKCNPFVESKVDTIQHY